MEGGRETEEERETRREGKRGKEGEKMEGEKEEYMVNIHSAEKQGIASMFHHDDGT